MSQKKLLGSAKTSGGNDGLETLSLGCSYVVNFVLPFAIELGLKSLLIKENKKPDHTHNLFALYNKLSKTTKQKLRNEFTKEYNIVGINKMETLEKLLSAHKDDFENWRYLEQADKLCRNEIEIQVAICTILEINKDDDNADDDTSHPSQCCQYK